MADSSANLAVRPRDVDGSRSARRLRRSGFVPGVIYGGGGDPQPVQIETLTLKRTLQHAGQILELDTGEGSGVPVLIKDTQRHPVTGEPMHIDFLRVRLDQAIHATVVLDVQHGDESPGAKEGGVVEQVTRELNIEALPGDIPETIAFDASALEMNATVTLAEVTIPSGVTLLDDVETVIVSVSPPRLEVEADEEIEAETELVGDPDAAEAEAGEDAPDEPGTVEG